MQKTTLRKKFNSLSLLFLVALEVEKTATTAEPTGFLTPMNIDVLFSMLMGLRWTQNVFGFLERIRLLRKNYGYFCAAEELQRQAGQPTLIALKYGHGCLCSF